MQNEYLKEAIGIILLSSVSKDRKIIYILLMHSGDFRNYGQKVCAASLTKVSKLSPDMRNNVWWSGVLMH